MPVRVADTGSVSRGSGLARYGHSLRINSAGESVLESVVESVAELGAEVVCLLVLLVLSVVPPANVAAQSTPEDVIEKQTRFKSGAELLLTNSGFAIGGYVRDSLSVNVALTGELSFGSIKDEREDAFINRLGKRSIPGKANYLLVLPGRIGVQRRLFSDTIEDSFRPFVQVTVGPTLGWRFPYFDDCNGNGSLEPEADCNADGVQEEGEGEARISQTRGLGRGTLLAGGGGSIGLGAYIRYGDRGVRGFRISYSFDYFAKSINLLESDIRGPQRFFGTPSIVVFFGHLF